MKYLFFILLFVNSYCLQAQKVSKIKLKEYRIAYLETKLKETSGLCFFKNKLYTFNDGGNPSSLYEINVFNGEIVDEKTLKIPNHDWEAIAIDSSAIYLGDFGNNLGTRKDLTIYKLHFANTTDLDSISKIEFEFANQTDFSSNNLRHDFDVEAMIWIENKLHLFSKEWLSKKTSHYIVNPAIASKQMLKPIEVFKTNFMVTDAAYFDNTLYLVGYKNNGRTFLLIFSKDENSNFFTSQPKKYKLGSLLNIGQIEGITVNEKGLYISGEGISKSIIKIKPSLYFIPHSVLKIKK